MNLGFEYTQDMVGMSYPFDWESRPFDGGSKTRLPGNSVGWPVVMSVTDVWSPEKTPLLFKHAEGAQWAFDHLSKGGILLAQNYAYDLACLCRVWGEEFDWPAQDVMAFTFKCVDQGQFVDTFIREKLLQIATSGHLTAASMEFMARKYLGKERKEEKKDALAYRRRYDEEWADLPFDEWPEGALAYAADDPADTWEIALKQFRRNMDVYPAGYQIVRATPRHPLGEVRDERAQTRWYWALFLMGCNGCHIQPEIAQAAYDLGLARQASLEHTLMDHGIYSLNKSGPRKGLLKLNRPVLVDLVTKAWGGEPPRNPVTEARAEKGETVGSVKTDSDTIETAPFVSELPQVKIAWEDDKQVDLLSAYQKYAAISKENGTYLGRLKGTKYRSVSYDPLVSTGRASARAGLQNPPQQGAVRLCHVADPNATSDETVEWVFCAHDFSSLEVRTFAQTLEDLKAEFGGVQPRLARKFQEDPSFDPHAELAGRILHTSDGYNYSYNDILEILKDPDHKLFKRVKQLRQGSKPCNFGLPGGMGWKTLLGYARGYGVHFTPEQAKMYRELWLASDPGYVAYLNYISRITSESRAKRDRVVVHHVSSRVKGGLFYTEAANSYFQGRAADGAKRCAWALALASKTGVGYPRLKGSEPWAFIHDEFIVRCKRDRAVAVAQDLETLMIQEMQKVVPDVPILVTPSISARWEKGAELKGSHGNWKYELLVGRDEWDERAKKLVRKYKGVDLGQQVA